MQSPVCLLDLPLTAGDRREHVDGVHAFARFLHLGEGRNGVSRLFLKNRKLRLEAWNKRVSYKLRRQSSAVQVYVCNVGCRRTVESDFQRSSGAVPAGLASSELHHLSRAAGSSVCSFRQGLIIRRDRQKIMQASMLVRASVTHLVIVLPCVKCTQRRG